METSGNLSNDPQAQARSRIVRALAQVKREWLEGSFYCLLAFALLEACYIVWDMLTLMPWFARFIGLTVPNTRVATPLMSDVYLMLLGLYGGAKEAKKWSEALRKEPAQQPEEIEEQALWFNRGTKIVFSWMGLLLVGMFLDAQHWIGRMPHELARAAMQSVFVWATTMTSGEMRKGWARKKAGGRGKAGEAFFEQESPAGAQLGEGIARAARLSDEHRELVLEYLKTNSWINNAMCREITGLRDDQAKRLLSDLSEKGRILKDGEGKGTRYRLSNFLPGA